MGRRAKPKGARTTGPMDDPRIAEIVRRIVAFLHPRRVILFGSRARGDADRFSDIDLAVDLDTPDSRGWCDLLEDLETRPATLLDVDVVALSELEPDRRRRIERQGVVLHAD